MSRWLSLFLLLLTTGCAGKSLMSKKLALVTFVPIPVPAEAKKQGQCGELDDDGGFGILLFGGEAQQTSVVWRSANKQERSADYLKGQIQSHFYPFLLGYREWVAFSGCAMKLESRPEADSAKPAKRATAAKKAQPTQKPAGPTP